MPSVCSAYNCTNRSNQTTNISFFKFPLKNKELTKRWVVNMRRDKWAPTSASYLCSSHFEEKFMYRTNSQRRLLASAVSTIFSFPDHLNTQKTTPRPGARKRALEESNTTSDKPSVEVAAVEVSTDHGYSLPSPRKVKKMYDDVVAENFKLKKEMKYLKQCSARNKTKFIKLESLISGLKKRMCGSVAESLNSDHNISLLKELLELQSKNKVFEYSEQIRKFSLTLHFYSSKAYTYLRKFVKLPHPRTLRQWATAVDGSPGFTEESFQKIKSEVQETSSPIFGTLMFDEMAIKNDFIWEGKKVSETHCNRLSTRNHPGSDRV